MKICWLIAVLLLICTPAWGQVMLVPSEYGNIQSAINEANDGDIVIVSDGNYVENINFLGNTITVRSTEPNDANIVAKTIIDGSNPADPNYASTVTFNSGEDANSVLSGFTITGGTGSWLPVSWEYKGLRWNRCGGAVLCYNMSAPTISNNIFIGNIAGEGGAIYCYGDPVNGSNPSNPAVRIEPVIKNNTFLNNLAIVNHGFEPPDTNYPTLNHGDGGAIVGFQGCDAVVTGSLISNNHADFYGGGIHLRQWSNGLIENNHIIDNNSALGAGIHITYSSSPIIRNNVVQSNIAGDFGGGGIYVIQYSNPLIEKNLITGNESTNGAGVYVTGESSPVILNNLIVNNINGAGIRIKGSGIPVIINNTIVGNTASESYGGGVDIMSYSIPFIENNIIASNGDSYGIYAIVSPPILKYNNVWDNGAGNYNSIIGDQTGVNGNISVDPLFVDQLTDDYHLKSNGWRWDMTRGQWHYDEQTSRCIDAGNPGYSLADELLVVPDDPNVQWAQNLRINMGAYGGTTEASLAPYPDFNTPLKNCCKSL